MDDVTLAFKVCHTCKQNLPASAYCKGNIAKYYKCKECERKRLANYRKSLKEEIAGFEGSIICLGCKESVTKGKINLMGRFANVICKSCYYKVKTHARPHKAELINGVGECTRCAMFGQSLNCIRPHSVDLDEFC